MSNGLEMVVFELFLIHTIENVTKLNLWNNFK